MIQDSTNVFLQKPSAAPFENPSIFREKREPAKDSAKIKYLEKFVSKPSKSKDKDKKDKNKKSDKGKEKKTEKESKKGKEKLKSETKKSEKEKKKTQEADSVFRFKDIDNTSSVIENVPSTDTVSGSQFKIFSGHQLKQRNEYAQPTNREANDWIFFTLVVAFGAFVWVKVFYSKIFQQIVQAFFNNRITNQIVRDENILVQRASVLLTIIYNLVISLFLYQVSVAYAWNPDYVGTGFNRFLVFAFAISFIYTIKLLILKVIGHVFMIDKAIVIYIFNIFLINNLLGITLLPVLTFISFSHVYKEYAIILAIVLIACAFLYRIIRGWLIGMSYSRFSILYLFLYLCALEIAPLLILVKLLVLRDF